MRRGAILPGVRRVPQHDGEHERRRRTAAGHRQDAQCRPAADARNRSGDRAAVLGGRRQGWRRGGGHPESRDLAGAVRRTGRARRTRAARWPSVDHHRRAPGTIPAVPERRRLRAAGPVHRRPARGSGVASGHSSARPIEGWGLDRPGSNRSRGDCRTAREGLSRNEQPNDDVRDARAGGDDPGCAHGIARAACGRRRRAAHCLYQRRRVAPGAWLEPEA